MSTLHILSGGGELVDTPGFNDFGLVDISVADLASHFPGFEKAGEGTLRAKNGRVVPVLIHGNNLRDSDGEKLGNASFVADLTEQKRSLALAGKVQCSLIPSSAPLIDGLDIAGRSNSCEEVGGDYFDFLFGPGFSTDTLKVVVGDISGHGVDAALLMTSARAFIRTRATQTGSPSGVVTAMNRDISTDMGDTGHFMPLFFMEIDPKRGTVQWVRAGHDPALLYSREEDRFDELMGTGLPLGVDGEFSYADNALADLSPGTVIALGTDGISSCLCEASTWVQDSVSGGMISP